MARLTPASLVVPVVVVVLAVVAWFASPQHDGVLERAADRLEEAGVVHVEVVTDPLGSAEAHVSRVSVDYERGVAVIEDPQPGVVERVVEGGRTFDRLPDGTWLELEDAPELFGQDPAAQLRAIDDDSVHRVADGRYRIFTGDGEALLVVGPDGLPRRLDASVVGSELGWRLVGTGGRFDVEVPEDALLVDPVEHLELTAQAAREQR